MAVFKIILFSLAIFASAACMVLLYRAYLRRRIKLLMWSSLCFAGLTLNNIALVCDLIIFPDIELRPVRLIAALVGMLFLLYGFLWDSD